MIYDAIDMDWEWSGDYILGDDGDLKDTSDNQLRSLETEIGTICKASLLDWERDPTIGCHLSDFIGEANTRETGKDIENRIRNQLIAAQLVKPEDIFVKVVPVGLYRVMVIIRVLTIATANNKLVPGDMLSVSLVFDSTEQSEMVLPNLHPQLET